MQKKELTCIGCPLGCALTVTLEGAAVCAVCGNTCPRGEAYARKELTNPTRIVTTTVRVRGGTMPMASVRTAEDIPKGKMFACVAALKEVVLDAPVTLGQVVLPDVAETGVAVLATRNVPRGE